MNRLSHTLLLLCAALLLAAPSPSGRAAPRQAGAAAESQDRSTLISFVSGLGGGLKHSFVDGNTAYLIEGAHLTVLDISAPAAPRLRSRSALPGPAYQVAAANGFVYLLNSTDPATPWVYDARDPAAPRLVGQLLLPKYVYSYRMQIAGGGALVCGPGRCPPL
jgi:hypothetical protein